MKEDLFLTGDEAVLAYWVLMMEFIYHFTPEYTL
jgi:hypothetical protein